ncbi:MULTISPECIES: hypothetical protein [unclassified Microcoleus]|uniref:hypothetical protein n=1 Tax=unclassified Microcoleus TaxID=2642155 RepID=UPI002FD4B1DA
MIFCTGEDIGIPVVVLCGAKPDRPKIVVYFHNIDRLRGRVALKLFGLADKIDLFAACASPQTNGDLHTRWDCGLNCTTNQFYIGKSIGHDIKP